MIYNTSMVFNISASIGLIYSAMIFIIYFSIIFIGCFFYFYICVTLGPIIGKGAGLTGERLFYFALLHSSGKGGRNEYSKRKGFIGIFRRT